MPTDPHFLSAQNPLATADQRAAEDTALRLLARPELRKAREQAAHLFRWVMTADLGEEIGEFESFVDEYMFHYALRAANSDPNAPKVVRFMAPPHHWFGRDVPGSRWAGDCPDFIYRTVAVAHGPRYEIRGRATCAQPPTAAYSLMEDRPAAPTILSLLESLDMALEPNGDFTITVDPSPAGGRRNHIQTQPGVWQIWIRDALADWAAQSANALRVHRLDPPDRDPMSDEELARWAVRNALDGVYYLFYLTRTTQVAPENVIVGPRSPEALGGLPSQVGAGCPLQIGPDEAVIVTSTTGSALFRNAVLTESYWRTLNYGERQTSLTSGQVAANEDGRVTYVIAHQDPGVHNWLDTCGRTRVKFGQRWQAFDRSRAPEMPASTLSVVKFADLENALPPGVKRIDAAGRSAQIARRQAGFRQRFIDS